MSFADLIAKKSGVGGDSVDEWAESPEHMGLLPEPSRAGSLEAFIQKHGHVTEEYSFYNGEVTLRFDTEEHRYFRLAELGNLIPVNGVTNTVGIIDKSHMLTPWAAKMAIQKLLRIMPTEMVQGVIRIKPLTFEEFTTIALEAKTAHKDKLDEASDIGHMAHKCLEDSIHHAVASDPEKIVRALINLPVDPQAANAANSGFNWMQQHNVRWVETETKIYSREFDYAGTMDGLALCDSCNDKACCPEVFKDRLSLIDWKSSNYLKIEYLFQTASYKHAKQEEHPELKIIDTWILRLGKNEEEAGKFFPWHMTPDEYEEDFKGFLACLSLTRLVDSVEERMSSQKATIRTIKKEQKETAKALAKEQEKLQKALEKAEKKAAREAEKIKIKAEAKAVREALKLAKKEGETHRMEVQRSVKPPLPVSTESSILSSPTISKETECTSSENANAQNLVTTSMNIPQKQDLKLDTTIPEGTGIVKPFLVPQTAQVHSTTQEHLYTSSTEATEVEVFVPPFKLPME